MTDKTFEQSYKWEVEKGLTNERNDKGGLTNDGITLERFNQVCKKVLGCKPTDERFKALTKDEVKRFYAYSFKMVGCDKIENEIVAAVCFDFALNSSKGKREIQKVLVGLGYKLTIDNIFGEKTIRCINRTAKIAGPYKLCSKILEARQNYVNSLVLKDESQRRFLKGWTNRIEDWKRFAFANT